MADIYRKSTETNALMGLFNRHLTLVAERTLKNTPVLYEFADKLDQILIAVETDEWPKAGNLWSEYQQMEINYGPKLK